VHHPLWDFSDTYYFHVYILYVNLFFYSWLRFNVFFGEKIKGYVLHMLVNKKKTMWHVLFWTYEMIGGGRGENRKTCTFAKGRAGNIILIYWHHFKTWYHDELICLNNNFEIYEIFYGDKEEEVIKIKEKKYKINKGCIHMFTI